MTRPNSSTISLCRYNGTNHYSDVPFVRQYNNAFIGVLNSGNPPKYPCEKVPAPAPGPSEFLALSEMTYISWRTIARRAINFARSLLYFLLIKIYVNK